MKNSAKNKIKALLLSAAAVLLPTHAQAEETATFMPDLGNNDDFFSETKRSWGKVFKNVAKLDKNGEVKYIAGHRSHSHIVLVVAVVDLVTDRTILITRLTEEVRVLTHQVQVLVVDRLLIANLSQRQQVIFQSVIEH